MRLIRCAILSIVIAMSSSLPATPTVGTRLRTLCELLMSPFMRKEERGVSADELKRGYNRLALMRTEAHIISRLNAPIRSAPSHFPDWQDAITLASVEKILDMNLANWREDGDWFFQATGPVRLYTPTSTNPKLFPGGSVILMNSEMAMGTVELSPRPDVQLFDGE